MYVTSGSEIQEMLPFDPIVRVLVLSNGVEDKTLQHFF